MNSNYLAVTTHSFKEELHELRVLHVVFLLDDLLVVEYVLRCKYRLTMTITKVQSFANTVEEG